MHYCDSTGLSLLEYIKLTMAVTKLWTCLPTGYLEIHFKIHVCVPESSECIASVSSEGSGECAHMRIPSSLVKGTKSTSFRKERSGLRILGLRGWCADSPEHSLLVYKKVWIYMNAPTKI